MLSLVQDSLKSCCLIVVVVLGVVVAVDDKVVGDVVVEQGGSFVVALCLSHGFAKSSSGILEFFWSLALEVADGQHVVA